MDRSPRRRAVPLALAVLALGAVWVAAPEVYTGTFSDLGTFLRVAALAGVLAGWVLLVRRLVTHRVVSATLAAGPVVIVVGILLWPYLRPATEVDEALPPAITTTTTTPTTTTTTPPPEEETGAAAPTPTTTPTTAPTTTPTTTTTTMAPPAPVELRRAGFQGLTGHRGSGDATVYDLGDGTTLLRFEEVDIGSGPRLDVYLVPGADQRGLGGGVRVAPLTAERGNQNYTVPDGIDLTVGTWTVLVWCETFDIEVANATLA